MVQLYFVIAFLKFSGILSVHQESTITEKGREDLDLPLFDFAIIASATNNFSERYKLGEGGFGPVYKVDQYISTYLPPVLW